MVMVADVLWVRDRFFWGEVRAGSSAITRSRRNSSVNSE